MNVIAIFDIGKTNKKFFLFNEQYKIVFERTVQFAEIQDEDGFTCDDVHQLSAWVSEMITEAMGLNQFNIKAFNFSAYGASFVHINSKGEPVTPLYNYLKPFPAQLKELFYHTYGGELTVSVTTASPVLGNLNSGMQLYRLKKERPDIFASIHYSLHLPQYISYLVSGKACAEITSIGSHTLLWDFTKNKYHDWVYAEKMDEKFPALLPSDQTVDTIVNGKTVKTGIGLHDSSSALIPYLACFSEPFILLSTGTWCISLNPFNDIPLTEAELQQDCLCYIEYHGKPVKASRLFAGNEHEQMMKKLAAHFKTPIDHYKEISFTPDLFETIKNRNAGEIAETGLHASAFGKRELADFATYEEAYHQLIYDLIQQQKLATSLVLSSRKISRIFVDGGFAKNPLYMNMLAAAFPAMEVYAASVSQATAIGAALAIHAQWNTQPVPGDMVEMKYYTVTH
jgi:sugar (pentulose or hexulose) kinase